MTFRILFTRIPYDRLKHGHGFVALVKDDGNQVEDILRYLVDLGGLKNLL